LSRGRARLESATFRPSLAATRRLIVRDGAEGRELVMARWGMPSPVFAFKGP